MAVVWCVVVVGCGDVYSIVNSRWFDYASILNTVLTCVMLALDSPVEDKGTGVADLINGLNYFVTIMFVIELFIRIMAMGLVFGEDCFLRDAWNVIEYVGVCFCWFAACFAA